MSAVPAAALAAFKQAGSWRGLEQRPLAMIADAQQHAGAVFEPLLGGGTRLMLALEHRISNGIDRFIRDPQWIGYLTPRDLFDWWTIETKMPADIPADKLAPLLKSKSAEIGRALDALAHWASLGLIGPMSPHCSSAPGPGLNIGHWLNRPTRCWTQAVPMKRQRNAALGSRRRAKPA